ncbi:hypothetical protein [Ferrovum myxofaciens]|uniref:hypothetical protein n=1 Tax=Ferrovum myxofaciens TaxID=416213 RepID=UPI001F21B3F8|nr:hypothetical protein [Ferrovum myxofaciens]
MLAFADGMMLGEQAGQRVWHMVEVKSSTGVKDFWKNFDPIRAGHKQTTFLNCKTIKNWSIKLSGDKHERHPASPPA